MQKNSLVIILFSVCCSISFGQDIRLVASSSEKGVELKWFYKELIAPEGVNLYEQKNDGQWNKLNQKPIKKGDYSISNQELSQDKELKKHVDLVSSTKKLEGFGLLLATIKSIKSSSYARFLGMYYFVEISDTTSDYRYKVALIKDGKEFQFSEITIKEFKSNKSKVEDITFDQKLKKVNFTWTHSENKFFAYNIYRSTSKDSIGELITKDPVILSKVKNEKGIEEYPKSFFEDRFVKEKNTYYYRVVGIDFFFHEQEMSEPITIRIKDQTAPSAPKIISKKEIKEGFKISWELDHVEEDVNGIVLFLSERNDTLLKRVENVKINKVDREFEIKFPIIGTYLVKIATEDEDGNLGFSNEYVLEYLDKIPPARPDNVSIQIDSTFLKISWNENNETDLLGYKVYRGINGDLQSMSLQNAAPIKKAEFVDQLPKNAKNNFTYYIIAVDTVLNESERSTFVSEKLLDVVPPKAPFIKSVDVTKEGAQLVWVKNTERDLYKYEVHRKKISDSTATFEKINLSFLDRSSDGFL